MHRRAPSFHAFALAMLSLIAGEGRGDISIHTDFDGGSAKVVSIDQKAHAIRLKPGGEAARGWPCWWYFRAEGLPVGEDVTFEVMASEQPLLTDDKRKGKRVGLVVTGPDHAFMSADGATWTQTPAGEKKPADVTPPEVMSYRIKATASTLWLAWGPPFLPKDTAALAEKHASTWKPFELARTLEGHGVTALRSRPTKADAPAILVLARQHAWECGGSWVCAGFIEWLASDEAPAVWLREHAEVIAVPIMDVDRVLTGDGGKEGLPHDHNRDWSDAPHYPEVAAAQTLVRDLVAEKRFAVFFDLHNPGTGGRSSFFALPKEHLSALAAERQTRFIEIARDEFQGPIPFSPITRFDGPDYSRFWQQIGKNWVHSQAAPDALKLILETVNNIPAATIAGYRETGADLGRSVATYLQQEAPPKVPAG